MKEMIIQAVDIGTTKVAAIVARKTPNNKLEILGLGTAPSFGVRKANVYNISQTIVAIQTAVAQAETQSGIKFKDVYVGVAGSHVKSLQHRGVLMRADYSEIISEKDLKKLKDDLHRLALPPGDTIVEILAQEYIVDNEHGITDPIGMPGSRIEGNYHVITGSTTAIENIKRCIKDAGLNVKDVVMQPLASAAAVLSDEEKQAGVALVDIGGGTTDLAVFIDGVIAHTAVIPFGGESITDDIHKGCSILRHQAEKLKVNHGSAYSEATKGYQVISVPGLQGRAPREVSSQTLSGIIQARMEEILSFVFQELEISGMTDKLLAGIVLTGGGSKLKHIKQLTEYQTGFETRLGLPNEHLAKTKVQDVDNPSYATGIGLIINALNKDSFEQAVPIVEQKSVEKPTIVEKEQASKIEQSVALESEVKKSPEPVIPPVEKTGKGSTFLKTIMTRVGSWMGEDLTDFQDTNNHK